MVFSLSDANGEHLGMSTSDWQNIAVTITFEQFRTGPLTHRIIDRKNLWALMHE